VIAAILRAQFLSMRFGGVRAAALSVIAGGIWYALWCFVAISVYAVAAQTNAGELRRFLPLGLLAVFAYWQIVPVLSASMGSGLDLRKLLVYPIPHDRLFFVELLLRVITGLEMILVTVAGVAGLIRNPAAGGWRIAPGLAAAVLLFLAFNLLLASGVRSVLERLLAKRRVREILGILLISLYVLPRLLISTGARPGALRPLTEAIGAALLPWTAAARAGVPLQPGAARWLEFAVLGAWTLAAGWFGRTQFERNLRYDALAAQATPLASRPPRWFAWSEAFYRSPAFVLPDPLAAIVEKELRTLARAPRFRTVFIMGFSFGLAVWFPAMAGSHGAFRPMPRYFLVVVAVYALTLLGQVSYWNCFGFDRSAAAVYFIAPQPRRTTLVGKNIASLVFVYLELGTLSVVTLALRLVAGWPAVAEAFLVVAVCSLYMLGIGNLASVHYPHPLTPERVSHGGASRFLPGLMFLLYPLTLLPVFLAYLARWALRSDLAFALMLALAAVIGGVVYTIAMQSAVSAMGRRREQILSDLSRGEGPVAAN
jgi:ABC-2 type transport system permease protein